MQVRVKICGMTRPEDAAEAARLGADAVGLVFAAGSPRELSPEQAADVAAALPPSVARVGVFRDTPAPAVEAALAAVPLDMLQFHGEEPPGECTRWNRPWLKAVPMNEQADAGEYMKRYHGAAGFLLDAHAPGEAGGRGRRFDWKLWPAHSGVPLILAGGLTPDNVGEAVRRTRPWGVDVSSGVESAPGIKDGNLMQRFMAEVARAGADIANG